MQCHSRRYVLENTEQKTKTDTTKTKIGLCMVLRLRQHSIGYTGDGFHRSKDPTNSIKILKEKATKDNPHNTKKTQNTHMHTHTK